MKSIWLSALLLMCISHIKAQNPVPVKPRFKLVFEKVWLHTDRDIYAKGDTLWFKAYLVNAQDNTPATSSGNLHVELISPEAKIISSELILLSNGSGNGDFEPADSIPAGKYRLRAYTSWMRNFGNNFIFEKEITIVNPEAAPVIAAVSAKGTQVKINKSTIATTVVPARVIVKALSMRFYPEGGSLVQGVSSLVAVKAGDAFGKGTPVSGMVLTLAGDTITRFNTDSLGMGLFTLLPVKGQFYHAVVNGGGKGIFDLPQAVNDGPALQIKQTDAAIHAIIHVADTAAKAYHVTIKHAGVVLVNQPVNFKEQVSVNIPTESFPAGLSVVTVYDQDDKPSCERLVYIHKKANGITAIATSRKTYQSKEKVTVNIASQPNTNLSMAVVDAGVVPDQPDDIVSYLMLGSEIKGNIEQAHRYFDTTNINAPKQLDLLLMTQGWRDFVWRRLADTSIHISYAAESGLQIQGTLAEKNNNKPLPNTSVTLFDNNASGNKLFATLTDSAGKYHFNNLLQYGNNLITITARDNKGNDAGNISADTARTTPLAITPEKNWALMKIQDNDTTQYHLIAERAAAQRNLKRITKLKEVKVKANYIQLRDTHITTFGYPDEVLIPRPDDDLGQSIRAYILYASKQAILENEAEANYGKMQVMGDNADGMIEKRIAFYADGKIARMRVVIDGYEIPEELGSEAVKNVIYNTYFDMPLAKAEKVVIKHGLLPGRGLFHMFIIYITFKPGALEGEHDNIAMMKLNGYYHAREFYKPLYTANTSQPDLRTTLHWEPNIKTDAAGKASVSFYNSDPKTRVKIFVQGITDKGVPVSAATAYETN